MISVLSVAMLLAAPQAVSSAHPADSATAFVNVSVIPMDRERVLTDQTVLVRGDRIVAIGAAAAVAVPAEATRIDGRGKFLMPGLADMHSHSAGAREPGALLAYLASGVTTIRLMEGGPNEVVLRDQVKRGEVLGPTMYTAGSQIRRIGSPAMAVKVVEEYKAGGYDFIKMRNPQFTLEVLDSFVATARRVGIPFEGHVPRGEVKMDRWLEARPRSVEHLDTYWSAWLKASPAYQGTAGWNKIIEGIENGGITFRDSALDSVVDLTRRTGVWNVPTAVVFRDPGSGAQLGMTAAQHQRFGELFDQIVKRLHDAGAGLLAGTDALIPPGVYPGPSLHTELQLLAGAGLTPYEALRTGTRNPAEFFGTLDQTGTIETGKRADLVLLSGNPLADIANTRTVLGVMLGGQWLARPELEARMTALGVPETWR